MGSRRMARSAGIKLPASATVVSTRVTPAKVGRSMDDTPKSNPAMRCETISAPAKPTPAPAAARMRPGVKPS